MSQGEEIGRRVKAARIARGLTQAGLAKLTGVKQQQIARIELGRTEFSRALPALSSVLDLDLPIPDWLAKASRSALPAPKAAPDAASVLACLRAYVREHGKREGLLDALLPPERQDEAIGLAMKLIESLTKEDHL